MVLLHFAWKAKHFFLPEKKGVTQGRRKLHNEIYNLHFLPHLIRVVRWAEHVERKTVENFFHTLVGQPEDTIWKTKQYIGRQYEDGS
jgi:hypothetical protein